MKENIFCLGRKSCEGEYNRVLGCGQICFNNSDINSLYFAGEININNSSINKIKSCGKINIESSKIKCAKIAGMSNLTKTEAVVYSSDVINSFGYCKCKDIYFSKLLDCEYLEADRIIQQHSKRKSNKRINREAIKTINSIIDNTSNIRICGDINCDTMHIEENIIFQCDINLEKLISRGKINTDVLNGESLWLFNGIESNSINADNIFIHNKGDVHIDSIVGGSVIIKSKFNNEFGLSKLNIKYNKDLNYLNDGKQNVIINSIEADNIILEGVSCKYVSGNNITIGDLCVIDKVEYFDKVDISQKSVVVEVNKL